VVGDVIQYGVDGDCVCVLTLPSTQNEGRRNTVPPFVLMLNKTVAKCKDLKIEGIKKAREGRFEPGIEEVDFSGNKLSSINPETFGIWSVLNLRFSTFLATTF